jgi:lipopolysaccharide export LptBFGC system permease protein LptF
MAPVFNITYLAIAAIPLAVFIANFFLMTRFKRTSEIIFIFFLTALIFENYS